MVECVQPRPGEVICDPACGTGGFLLAAHDYIANQGKLDRDQKKHLRYDALRGVELVDGVSRLCAMNLFLHGVGPDDNDREPPIKTEDALRNEPSDHVEVVLTNPPFGKKSSSPWSTRRARPTRRPSPTTARTSGHHQQAAQLRPARQVAAQEIHGRAAVVVPDNVLFEGGAGETVRRKLLHECDVHTLLRLPTGIFYAQGVKANVLFFDRKPGSAKPWTKQGVGLRPPHQQHFTLKTKPMTRADLDEFVACYRPATATSASRPGPTRSPRAAGARSPYEEIVARDKCSLDLFWLRDESLEDSASLPDPHVLTPPRPMTRG
jgi:type I restriction enzyme M protein